MTDLNHIRMPTDKTRISLHQSEKTDKFEYIKDIGSLEYGGTQRKPDIAYVIKQLTNYSKELIMYYWIRVEGILCYQMGTIKK